MRLRKLEGLLEIMAIELRKSHPPENIKHLLRIAERYQLMQGRHYRRTGHFYEPKLHRK